MQADKPSAARDLLVLGIGNSLMSDDGAGPCIVAGMAEASRCGDAPLPGVRLVDGGTCGLMLLPEIEACSALIVIDAARLGGTPGAVTVFEGEAMDAMLRGPKHTAHEVAVCDLLDAAACTTGRPARRALIAVEPERIAVGDTLTPAVAAALAVACGEARALIARWRA
jgi:hydrogenase maturation protease